MQTIIYKISSKNVKIMQLQQPVQKIYEYHSLVSKRMA